MTGNQHSQLVEQTKAVLDANCVDCYSEPAPRLYPTNGRGMRRLSRWAMFTTIN